VAALVLQPARSRQFFELLGRDENDMTAALGRGLSQSETLLRRFVDGVVPAVALEGPTVLELQRHSTADGGFTDVELRSSDAPTVAKPDFDAPPGLRQTTPMRQSQWVTHGEPRVVAGHREAGLAAREIQSPWANTGSS
jgi:hypothetical protein